MEGFDHILNWTLKRGSHQFPGPDGGTCINEAALVAAGFEYRPIASVRQMPRCFSRPICYLALWLNDNAEDTERQLLLPFVTRLACADTWEIEKEREAYIRSHMPKGALTVQKGIDILEGALAIGRQGTTSHRRYCGPGWTRPSTACKRLPRSRIGPFSARSRLGSRRCWSPLTDRCGPNLGFGAAEDRLTAGSPRSSPP